MRAAKATRLAAETPDERDERLKASAAKRAAKANDVPDPVTNVRPSENPFAFPDGTLPPEPKPEPPKPEPPKPEPTRPFNERETDIVVRMERHVRLHKLYVNLTHLCSSPDVQAPVREFAKAKARAYRKKAINGLVDLMVAEHNQNFRAKNLARELGL